jgi:hypothetical protein
MGRTMKCLAGLLVVAGIAVCSNPIEPISEKLPGFWIWIESSGGITGQVRTPSSSGETMALRFFGSDGVELSRNGSVEAKTTYVIEHRPDVGTVVIYYKETIFGFGSQSIRFESDETLFLTDPCCDGFVYRFERSS